MAMVFCRGCGKEIHETAPMCPHCGAPQLMKDAAGASDKKILPAFLLCFFLGWLGVHRFYVGKQGTAVLMFLTFGGFGIVWLLDFINILIGSFTDKQGNKLKNWT